jgi:ABC-type multidrug transport system ATPase subunit
MTARESVEFAAAVRLPRGTTRDVQTARVDLVLQLMGLAEQQHMLVSLGASHAAVRATALPFIIHHYTTAF